jgi:hypothetical protein
MRRRTPALVVVAALVVALLLLDRDPDPRTVTRFGRAAAAMPTADDGDALSSTWFCAAGGASQEVGPAVISDVVVTITNAAEEARSGTVSWLTGPEQRTDVPVQVPARGALDVPATPTVAGLTVSAVVELDGGEVAVEHRIVTAQGDSAATCASGTSSEWYFADGTTARDATQQLVLFNPTLDDAVVDIALATDEGAAEPEALQGVPIRSGATEVIELADVVRRRAVTATSVRARSGRVVADRVQRFDGSEGRTGVSLALGAPALATQWVFPQGGVTEGVVERWHLYNPNDDEALTTLEMLPDLGEAPEPVDLAIPPRTLVTVEASELARIPPGAFHATTVRSTNGVPVVAERSLDIRPPALEVGWTSALGAPVEAERWAVPLSGPAAATEEWILIVNLGAEPVTATVTGLGAAPGPIAGVPELTVEPSRRVVVPLALTGQPLVIDASGPVVVERLTYAAGAAPGISSVMGVPLPPTG